MTRLGGMSPGPLLFAGAIAAVVAACGTASTPGSAPTPTAPQTTPASTASATVSPSGQALSGCRSSGLRLTLGGREGAAGTFYQRVDFENVGSLPCTLTGYPGVSFLDSAGRQVGHPAERAGLGVQVSTVVVPPGGFANAVVALPSTDNFPAEDCEAAGFTNLRVFPPNETVAALVPLTGTVCTTDEGHTQVSPVQAGRG